MILGIEDIAGGTTALGFLLWLGFTGLFYLVNYLAVVNVLDDLTRNHPVKLLALPAAAVPSAFLIAIFNYNPFVLFLLMCIANFFRVRDLEKTNRERLKDLKLNKPLFYAASYLYIVLLYGLTAWFQHPVELDGLTKPYWKSWFHDVPH